MTHHASQAMTSVCHVFSEHASCVSFYSFSFVSYPCSFRAFVFAVFVCFVFSRSTTTLGCGVGATAVVAFVDGGVPRNPRNNWRTHSWSYSCTEAAPRQQQLMYPHTAATVRRIVASASACLTASERQRPPTHSRLWLAYLSCNHTNKTM